jgi:hypothetical protein
MICPDCQGAKQTIASHVRYSDGSGAYGVPLACSRCNATGEVPDEMAEWMRRGKVMRDKRVNGKPYRSLHAEAKRRGMKASELSAMERGRIEPREE